MRVWHCFAEFFACRDKAMKICEGFDDWSHHTRREWELEYDFLFRGMDADRNIPLWASVSKDEQVLQNQTTLEVIRFYHRLGYRPISMEGNPPDYIGEQMRFLAYLTAALMGRISKNRKITGPIERAEATERSEAAGITETAETADAIGITDAAETADAPGIADAETIQQARADFIRDYVLDTAKMVRDAVSRQTAFTGFVKFLKRLLQALADFEETVQSPGGTDEAETVWKAVMENGLYPPIADEPPRTINTAGLNNCGGICVIRPTVSEGCMLDIRSDTSSNHPQIRACVRGRGYRKTFLNPGRLRYPMKRLGKRGSGKFERLSWEEAVDLLADNWKRIKDAYGPGSRYVIYATGVEGILQPRDMAKRLLSLDGGFLDYFNSYSSACVNYTTPYIFGTDICGNSPADMQNTKLLILWGDNPAETIFGPERNYYLSQVKEKGIRIIVIDPRQSQTAVAFADQWIPINPASDSALADAMAYVIWSENLQDQHFMDTYCLGFDEAHMPEEIPEGSRLSYHSYLFGVQDGIEKTPEWAEPITGIPAQVIRSLAREYALAKPACIIPGLGPQRHGNGEQTTKGLCMLACLTGNIGIPGGGAAGNGNVFEHRAPALPGTPVENPYPGKIPVFLWTKAIEEGVHMTAAEDRVKGMERLESNIKMIVNLAGNTLVNQHSDVNDTIRILGDESKCEFIVTSDIFMTSSARYSDLILPATSVFEGSNIVVPWRGNNYLLRNNQVIAPLFECRFEWEWQKELAKKLGIYEEFVDGKPEVEQWLKESYEELKKEEPGLPEYQVFCEAGGWQFEDPVCYIAFEKEIADPENHPFATPSGKIEIFSKQLYDFHQPDIPPIPKYVPCPEGPEDSLREKYPLQLIGWHTRRRCHSIHDNNEWQDEVEMPGLWIHPLDAGRRGIRHGDLVEIWNDRGRVRIPAVVTHRIKAGVVAMSQGGWYTPDKKGTDVRGSINVLTSAKNPTPLAKGNPQHTNLVEVGLARD